MNIIQVSLCLIIIAILVKFIDNIRNKRLYKLLEQFPSYPTYSLIGNAHLLLGSFDDILIKIEKLAQPFDRLLYWIGPIPVLCLKKHEDIATVFSQSNDRDTLEVMDEWIGTGLLTARYEEWKKSRKMFTPTFSSKMLSEYLQVFNRNASSLVKKLKSVADTNNEMDISHCMMMQSLDTVLENSIGLGIQESGKSNEEFCNAIIEGTREISKRLHLPFLLCHIIYKIYLKLSRKIEVVNQLQSLPIKLLRDDLNNADNFQSLNDADHNDKDSSKTMLDLLIKKGLNKFGFTKTRMQTEFLQMIVAGTETTALNLSFLLLMLAINQDIQQKVYEEIAQFIADDEILTENHLNNLPYLEQCVKETLRMFSPVIVASRRVHKEIILSDNTIIPANMLVFSFIHFSQYDTDLYKDPLKWDPEHFNEHAVKERPKTSQLSFGYGPRMCIGAKYAMMYVKTQITHVLRNYHLSTSIKEFTKENLIVDLSIRSKIGFPVKFTTRRDVKLMGEK